MYPFFFHGPWSLNVCDSQKITLQSSQSDAYLLNNSFEVFMWEKLHVIILIQIPSAIRFPKFTHIPVSLWTGVRNNKTKYKGLKWTFYAFLYSKENGIYHILKWMCLPVTMNSIIYQKHWQTCESLISQSIIPFKKWFLQIHFKHLMLSTKYIIFNGQMTYL